MEGNGICNAAFCESAALREKALLGASGLNSLSQSLTALTAPSGREPLARPQTLCLNLKLCHYAKGPISEGAVERMRDWGSFLEGEGTDYVLRPLFSKSSDDFFPHFFSKAALTADFRQNSPGFGQSA